MEITSNSDSVVKRTRGRTCQGRQNAIIRQSGGIYSVEKGIDFSPSNAVHFLLFERQSELKSQPKACGRHVSMSGALLEHLLLN